MTEQWQELKETIIEMRDNDGTGTQQDACKFLVDYMEILEKQMQESCEDCISRQKALDCFEQTNTRQGAKYAIETLPSVTPRMNLAETSQDCISRAGALDTLKTSFLGMSFERYKKAKRMFEQLPSVTPTSEDIKEAYIEGYNYGVKDWFKSKTQPCEDAVSRSELLSHDFIITAQNGISHRVIYATRVEEAPSVTPERPKGKWLHIYKSDIACECSVCHIQMPITEYYHYCPNCGAYMGGGEDEVGHD